MWFGSDMVCDRIKGYIFKNLFLREISSPHTIIIGLRIHDNPALLEAMKPTTNGIVHLLPVFIFDGESAGNYKTFILLT